MITWGIEQENEQFSQIYFHLSLMNLYLLFKSIQICKIKLKFQVVLEYSIAFNSGYLACKQVIGKQTN